MFRRKHFLTQLHVAERVGEWPQREWRIAYSYRPIKSRSLRDARSRAHELRQSNRWASLNRWPHVTIMDSMGNDHAEWAPQ